MTAYNTFELLLPPFAEKLAGGFAEMLSRALKLGFELSARADGSEHGADLKLGAAARCGTETAPCVSWPVTFPACTNHMQQQ